MKALYQDVMWADLFKYAECYVKGFLKHPGVYFDDFFAHIYGWFDLGGETQSDIRQIRSPFIRPN